MFLEEVTLIPYVSSFTFDLFLPPIEEQMSKKGKPLIEHIRAEIEDKAGTSFKDVVKPDDGAYWELSNGQLVHTALIDRQSQKKALALRVTLSLEEMDENMIGELGEVLRSLLGRNLQRICLNAHAISLTAHVDLYDVTFARALPRFSSTGEEMVERLEYGEDGSLQIIRLERQKPPLSKKRLTKSKRSFNSASSILIEEVAQDTDEDPGILVLEENFELNLPITQLNELDSCLLYLEFAELPFSTRPRLPKKQVSEFFRLIKTIGIEGAIEKSEVWDRGASAEAWWEEITADWWDGVQIADECFGALLNFATQVTTGFPKNARRRMSG